MTFIPTYSRSVALAACPWAAVIVKVEAGYAAFATHADCAIWIAQK